MALILRRPPSCRLDMHMSCMQLQLGSAFKPKLHLTYRSSKSTALPQLPSSSSTFPDYKPHRIVMGAQIRLRKAYGHSRESGFFESKSAFIHKPFWQNHRRGKLSFIHWTRDSRTLLRFIYAFSILCSLFLQVTSSPTNLLLLWLTMKLLIEHTYL